MAFPTRARCPATDAVHAYTGQCGGGGKDGRVDLPGGDVDEMYPTLQLESLAAFRRRMGR